MIRWNGWACRPDLLTNDEGRASLGSAPFFVLCLGGGITRLGARWALELASRGDPRAWRRVGRGSEGMASSGANPRHGSEEGGVGLGAPAVLNGALGMGSAGWRRIGRVSSRLRRGRVYAVKPDLGSPTPFAFGKRSRHGPVPDSRYRARRGNPLPLVASVLAPLSEQRERPLDSTQSSPKACGSKKRE